jgi:hypothetical protein
MLLLLLCRWDAVDGRQTLSEWMKDIPLVLGLFFAVIP